MAAPSASPDVKGQFHPLMSASSFDDSVTGDEEYKKLKEKFIELDEEKQG